jgi:seryl-tRNA synthetase
LNSTLVATSRVLVSIMENFQNKDGHITIPGVLQKYMGQNTI